MAEVRYTLSLLYWGQFLAGNKHKLKKHTEVGGSQAKTHGQAGSDSLDWKRPAGQAGISRMEIRSPAARMLL